MSNFRHWLALTIGNSSLHWAAFVDAKLQDTWDTPHRKAQALERQTEGTREGWQEVMNQVWASARGKIGASASRDLPPLVLASVVPTQAAFWQNYPNLRILTLDQLPLQGLYTTLGIDRALAVLGAGTELGWPILVIDAGTALTVTGADSDRRLQGGAILPGLGLQFSSLADKTAALPPIRLPETLPQRWAVETAAAMQSGIVYTVTAGVGHFIQDWWQQFPDSKIVLTGGDRTKLLTYLRGTFPEVAAALVEAPHAIFWGMSAVIHDPG